MPEKLSKVRIATLLETEGYIGIEKRLPRGSYCSPTYTGKVPADVLAKREKLYKLCKRLNKRGG